MEYLEFEQPVKELIEQYEKCVQLGTESGIDVDESCKKIKDKIEDTKKKYTETLHLGKEYSFPDIRQTYTLDYIHGLADKEAL
jgi:acetyl-CoA carboxylase carboxyl transferase subunit alpha